MLERTLEASRPGCGPDHPETLACKYNLALAYKDAGRSDQAIPLFERTLAACLRVSAPIPLTLTCPEQPRPLAKMAVGDPG